MNVRFMDRLNQLAFGGSGEVDYWSKAAKRIAVEAASEAALESADINAACGPHAPASADSDVARFRQTAQTLAQGYGDIDYWSKRAKTLSFEAARHACAVATMCDGPALAAARPTMERFLADAQTYGFDGYGDSAYWSARTKDLASSLHPPAPASATKGPLSDTLRQLNDSYVDSLRTLAFDHYGDVSSWSKQAKRVALHAGAHEASLELVRASQRTYSDAERAAALQDIAKRVDAFQSKAEDAAWNGFGDTDYWSRRTKQLSLDTARTVAEIASSCDASVTRTAAPALKQALQTAVSLAFDGYGDTGYWSTRAKTMATDLQGTLSELCIDLVAQSAAEKAVTPGADPKVAELEAEVARQRVVGQEMDHVLKGHGATMGQVQGRLHDLSVRINPLVQQDKKFVKIANLCGKLTLAGFGTTLLGVGCKGLLGPTASAIIGGIGAVTLLGSMGTRLHALGKHQDIMAQYEPLNRDYEGLDRRKDSLNRAITRAKTRSDEAAAAQSKAQGQLDVMRMAAQPQPAPGTVAVDDGTVTIGGLMVPRKAGGRAPSL